MYTRKGDKGDTSLYGAGRVQKDSPRVEAYGTIDELNSLIGVAVSELKDGKATSALKEIQKMLFVAGADLASDLTVEKVPRITSAETAKLEEMTDELVKGLPKLTNFILPGGSPSGARLQLARAVCRRAERRLVTAARSDRVNPELLPFLNRLSTYLFDLSREVNRNSKIGEEVWKG